jgi:diacylglycerol kinase family enzyme
VLFAVAAFDTWLRRYDRTRPRLVVRLGDSPGIDVGQFAVCLNTDPYSYVGTRPFTIAPEATLDRALSVVTIRSLDAIPLLRVLASALGSGKHLRRSTNVIRHVDVSSATIEGYGPVPYQVDGDYLGDVDVLEIRYADDALALVFPVTQIH